MAKAKKAVRGDRTARHERVRRIASVLKTYEISPFQFEAACTHGLRSTLCYRGWPFQEAQTEAHKLVQAALDLIGARRPSWEMGQPEYVHPGLVERTRCARCARPLPEGHRLWCSSVCGDAARHAHYRADQEDELDGARAVAAIAWKGPAPKQRVAA